MKENSIYLSAAKGAPLSALLSLTAPTVVVVVPEKWQLSLWTH